MKSDGISLRAPALPDQWRQAAAIVQEYGQGLGVDLSFQHFEQELSDPQALYAPPRGAFLMAWVDGALAGCGGLRAFADCDYPNACEMRRLYVRKPFRRFGLGRLLAQALMDLGVRAGYSCMLLDTLDDMEAARSLYESLGFVDIPPYYYNPIPGSHYLKVELD